MGRGISLCLFLIALVPTRPVLVEQRAQKAILRGSDVISHHTRSDFTSGSKLCCSCRQLQDRHHLAHRHVLQLRGGTDTAVVGPRKRSRKEKVKQAKDDWLKDMMGGADDRDYDNVEYKFDFAYNEVKSPKFGFSTRVFGIS
jgi:hypothetical protein